MLLCLIGFVATGATVIWMTGQAAERAEWHSATATIWHRWDPSSDMQGTPSGEPPGLDAASVEREIISEQNLRRALGQVGAMPPEGMDTGPWTVAGQTVEQARRQLRVTGAPDSSTGRMGVLVTFRGREPDRAVRLVNTLAQGYSQQHRAKLEATVHQEYVKARDAAEVARREYLEAKVRFDDFVAQHFLEQQALVQRKPERTAEPDSPEPPPTGEPSSEAVDAPPPPIENPERVEFNRRLAGLQARRERLLTTRTPAHPEVRYVDTQIAALEERLASIPEEVAGPPPGPPPSEAPRLESAAVESLSVAPDAAARDETIEECAEAAAQYDAYKGRLEQARQEYDRLSAIKRGAWERELRAVSVELDLAAGTQLLRAGADRSPGSLLGALAAALAVALGVGMISAGFETDLPLTTPAEVERALRVPVVGTIPARESSPRRAPARGSRRARRLAKIVSGALLVAVCFGILVIVL